MPNMLQTGAAWLGQKLQASAGRSVTLQQGTTVIEGLTATLAAHDYDVMDADGFSTRVRSFDWIFVAADLVVDGVPFCFHANGGAVVKETVGSVETRYESMKVGTRPAAEDKDSSGVLVMVHTNKVGTNA